LSTQWTETLRKAADETHLMAVVSVPRKNLCAVELEASDEAVLSSCFEKGKR
jgi:hypothetical protein